jgi:hypothetical protein
MAETATSVATAAVATRISCARRWRMQDDAVADAEVVALALGLVLALAEAELDGELDAQKER